MQSKIKPLAKNANALPAGVLVSVVVVNYNGLAFLKNCLDSVAGAFGSCECEVIVVDNASNDGSQDYLKSRLDIRLIELNVNVGFCAGNNIGVAAARGKFALLLNNDTECLTSLSPLLECMNDELCVVAGCALYYADGRIQASIGFDHTPLRIVLSWLGIRALGFDLAVASRSKMDPKDYQRRHTAVDWISGACMLIRVEVWKQIGGFDEMFFMYCEDVDYCRRVRAVGFTIAYTPYAAVRHYEAAGKAWPGRLALLRTVRSYLLFTKKHFGVISQFAVAVLLGYVLLLRSLTYFLITRVRRGDGVMKEKIRAYFDAAIYLFGHGLARGSLGKTI